MNDDYSLAYGTHATPDDGRCAMEWVSHLAGEPHSDAPECVSPVVRAICVALNDGLPQGPRQRLRPYLTRTIGTACDGLDEWRAWLAMDWLARTYTPAWLKLAGLREAAAQLLALPEVTDSHRLRTALVALQTSAAHARAARAKELGVTRPSAWIALASSTSAARELAWECAGAAAWGAARLGIGDVAGDRARAAARSTAGDAAAIKAASIRYRGGRAAAREAVRAAFEPTRDALTSSAFELLDRMLVTETLELSVPTPPPAPAPARSPEPPAVDALLAVA